MNQWRVIHNKSYEGAMNMAIDEAIFTAYKKGHNKPTLRFYTWEPACLSIGYFQKLEDEIDLDKCRCMNIDYTRRITCGRAVLHDNELTYSIIIGEDNPLIDKSINLSYRYISEGLVKGLNLSGIETDNLNRGERISRENLSAACFNAHASYEVTINNKKVIGSAQSRKDGVLLQHGSIILDFDVEKLFKLIKTKTPELKERAMKFTAKKASGIENEIGRKIDIDILQKNIVKGLAEQFNVEFVEGDLTDYEKQLVKELYEKYKNEEYNKKR